MDRLEEIKVRLDTHHFVCGEDASWLITEVERSRENQEMPRDIYRHYDDFIYQRRHRKWALERARYWFAHKQHGWQYWRTLAEKAEAGELKAVVVLEACEQRALDLKARVEELEANRSPVTVLADTLKARAKKELEAEKEKA